jgi:hypothetical protein
MILGPNGPFTNLPPSIETQVQWIGRTVEHLAAREGAWLDARPEIEDQWTETCNDIANQTLFPRAASWIFGANIPGKPRTVMFYLGGLKQYRELLEGEAAAGYPGFLTEVEALAPAA